MRNIRIFAALTVAFAAMASSAQAGGWLGRGCGCDAPPKCAPEPSCCAPVSCDPCGKKSLGGRLKGMFRRGGGCGCGSKMADCGMDKGCGMEVAKSCNPCRPRFRMPKIKLPKVNLKGMFRRGCCDSGCGDKGGKMDDGCGCDKVAVSCGCDAAPKCKGPSLMDRLRSMRPKRSCGCGPAKGCGMEPSCGWGGK